MGLTFLQQWSGTSRIVWHPLPVLTVKVVLASHSYLGYSSLPAAEITPLLSSEKYQEMRVRRTDPFRLCRVRIMHVLEIIPHSAKMHGWTITPSHYLNQQLDTVWLTD